MYEALKVPEWDIIDGTKISAYQTCPRRFFYEYILGWVLDVPNHNLVFGASVHEALEYIYNDWKARKLKKYDESVLDAAYEVFLESYRLKYPAHTDDEHKLKSPENVRRILGEYVKRYMNVDSFDMLHTEIAGFVPVDKSRKIYFRLDAVVQDKRGVSILEHKTSSWNVISWANSWPLAIQPGTGLHVLNCIYGEDTYAFFVNGLFFRSQPRFKKNGEPYANSSKGNEFMRIPLLFTPERMEDWRQTVIYWILLIERDMDILRGIDNVDNVVMKSFSKCDKGCLSYGYLCPYHPYCTAWYNPLQRVEQMPTEFVIRHWDPRSLNTEKTTTIDLVEGEET